jgi:hypothetical protein
MPLVGKLEVLVLEGYDKDEATLCSRPIEGGGGGVVDLGTDDG